MILTAKLKQTAARLISKLPTWPPSIILSQALNQALAPIIEDGILSPLIGKHVLIIVEDLGLRFSFTLHKNRFAPINITTDHHLTIRATLPDFYLLATRQEDPDTLFFNRRLVIEGDTELGLIAKNAMDSLELPKPLLTLYGTIKKLSTLKGSALTPRLGND